MYTLSPDADAFARARFGRPSVFARVCPHVIDELRHEADRCRDSSQYEKAVTLYGEALAMDAHDFAARFGRASVQLRYGDAAAGRADLSALASEESAPRTWRDKSVEALADADFLDGRYDAAAERYRGLAARSLDEDGARTLEVKALGADRPQARPAVEALLLGARHRPPDIVLAAVELGAWSHASHEPLADYLIGKNLAQRGWYVLAAIYLDRVLTEGAPTPRIGREALRQRAVCACATRDAKAIDRVRALEQDAGGPFDGAGGGRKESLERLLARCSVDARSAAD
jgi:tetratricopeptide (TPR) repeat protein